MLLLAIAVAGLVAWRAHASGVWASWWETEEPAAGAASPGGGGLRGGAAPVAVAFVERGRIEDRRVFSGTLEATARVTLSPRVSGIVTHFPLDIADSVERGQVVAVLDSAEFEQAVMQAEAELAVARASLVEARNAAEIARRELDRVRTLQERGIASESQLDTARAADLASSSAVAVAEAQLTRAEAVLQTARIRADYTTIRATWDDGDDHRLVAERFVEVGDTVAANTPLLSIIELNPIQAIVYVTEREYGRLAVGQPVTLSTDAFPEERWRGEVARIAPVFVEGSRQARVEISVENADGRLKPGMFTRVEATLRADDEATIVPAGAIVQRAGTDVIFVVVEGEGEGEGAGVGDGEAATVRMLPVRLGIREGERVQVFGEGVDGRVVTLGQQLIGDGSKITIPVSSTAMQSGPPANPAASATTTAPAPTTGAAGGGAPSTAPESTSAGQGGA